VHREATVAFTARTSSPEETWRKWLGAFSCPFLLIGKGVGFCSDLSPGSSSDFGRCDNLFMADRHKRPRPNPEPSDVEVRNILVHSMADVGADPAHVYAFQKTGVYICDENVKRLPKASLKAFDDAVDEYLASLQRPPQ
jgi:hypothetical protein